MDSSTPNYGWAPSAPTTRSATPIREQTPVRQNISPLEAGVHLFCKNKLKSRIFLGHYQERRHVDSLSAYRDLIVLPDSEGDIINDLQLVSKRIHDFYKSSISWVGITDKDIIGAPHGLCLWTELDNLPFGQYWFEVKTVRFRDNEVLVRLKVIRPFVEAADTARTRVSNDNATAATVTSSEFLDLLIAKKNGFVAFFYEFVSTGVTAENVIASLKFICLLAIGILHGSVEFIKFLGYFTIRFMEEFRKLIHVCTPLFLGILDVLSKIMGGFYILIAMIWRDSKGGPPKPPTQQAIYYNQGSYQRRAIRYNDEDY